MNLGRKTKQYSLGNTDLNVFTTYLKEFPSLDFLKKNVLLSSIKIHVCESVTVCLFVFLFMCEADFV